MAAGPRCIALSHVNPPSFPTPMSVPRVEILCRAFAECRYWHSRARESQYRKEGTSATVLWERHVDRAKDGQEIPMAPSSGKLFPSISFPRKLRFSFVAVRIASLSTPCRLCYHGCQCCVAAFHWPLLHSSWQLPSQSLNESID